MDFDDSFIPKYFSRFFSILPRNSRGTSAYPSRHNNVQRNTYGLFAAHLWTFRVTPVCNGTPVENSCSRLLSGCPKFGTLLGPWVS
jgi:hypothetical protein